MRVTLLHNPGAGDGSDPEALVRVLEAAGHDVRYCSSKEKREKRDKALARPAALVVAAGGDGTVGTAARTLAGRKVPLTVLPLGTANNIATSFGIVGEAERLVEAWPRWRKRPHDMGRAEWGDDHDELFMESCGGGLFADVMRRAEKQGLDDQVRDDAMEDALELLDRLAQDAPPRRWDLEVGDEVSRQELIAVEVMLIPLIGPNIRLASSAVGDGKFTVVQIDDGHRDTLRDVIRSLQRTERPRATLPAELASSAELKGDGPMHIDGELVEHHGRIELSVLRGALTVLRP